MNVIQNGDGVSYYPDTSSNIPLPATLTINNTGAISFSGALGDSPLQVVDLSDNPTANPIDYANYWLEELPLGQNPYGGSLSLVKTGAGTLTLSGSAVAPTGDVTVAQGTLQMVNAIYWAAEPVWYSYLPAATITVSGGATLEYHLDAGYPGGMTGNVMNENVDGSFLVSGAGAMTLAGGGTFLKTGSGAVLMGVSWGGGSVSIAMAQGAVIDVEGAACGLFPGVGAAPIGAGTRPR